MAQDLNPTCEKCSDLQNRFEIRTPEELTKVIRVARANLADGTLSDITQPAHSPTSAFSKLAETAPWPDYVEHYFRCTTCGYGFRLSADTLHGAGGEWEPYKSASQEPSRASRLRGFRFLLASCFFLVTMLFFTTPVACTVFCNGPEQYPELVFLVYGVPLALLLVAIAIARVIWKSRR